MITLIAAIGKNNELGKNNDLIWKISEDLNFFKKTTFNHTVIMGYNTYKSIGKPLPNRRNVVLTSHTIDESVITYNDINELIKNEINDEEVFIIGGYSLYKFFYKMADKMYLTIIDSVDDKADIYFPNINENEWETKIIYMNNESIPNYKRVEYKKI